LSDIETVISAYPRIQYACRPTRVLDPEGEGALSAHQASILGLLDVADPTMVGELAEYFGVTASTMSLNLKRLEAGGFITRVRDPADRRVMNVRLTERGVRISEARSVLDPDCVDRMLQAVHPERRREAVRGIALLAEAADVLVASRRAAP
jgi:DNA-binding MarR family transcriptional regulator